MGFVGMPSGQKVILSQSLARINTRELENIHLARPMLDQIANKWSVLILTVLCPEPSRFNAIKRRLAGITHKSLTEALRRLERNGLIKRQVIATSPVAVSYSITPLGRSLQQPFEVLYAWALDHSHEVVAAQRGYDDVHLPSGRCPVWTARCDQG